MASVAMLADLPSSGELERTPSEQECDLMVEALRRELDGIRVGRRRHARTPAHRPAH